MGDRFGFGLCFSWFFRVLIVLVFMWLGCRCLCFIYSFLVFTCFRLFLSFACLGVF